MLIYRILSSLVLAPLALGVVWLGPPWVAGMAALGAAVMGWEWARLCRARRFGVVGALVVLSAVAAIGVAATGAYLLSLGVAMTGALAVWALGRLGGEREAPWTAIGTLWIALPCVALVWLSRDPDIGRVTIIWIFVLVWVVDTCAYAAGRGIGGPLLAPRLSPKKTWAGLLGGMAGAAVIGYAASRLVGPPAAAMAMLCVGLAIVEQMGDLAESFAKRHFGVKDASDLIPGHGGLLDRLDGMLVVLPAVAIVELLEGNPLQW